MSYRHILVAVDLTKSCQTVINKAVSLAKDTNAKLSFVFVDIDNVVMTHKEEIRLQKELQKLEELCDYPVTHSLVTVGDLHVTLSGIVKKLNIDLVVSGHSHKLMNRLFSSVPKLANTIEADLLIVYLDH